MYETTINAEDLDLVIPVYRLMFQWLLIDFQVLIGPYSKFC